MKLPIISYINNCSNQPTWLVMCGGSWIIFIIFEISIQYVCNSVHEFKDFNYEIHHNMNFISFGTFLILWTSLLYKMIYIYKERHVQSFGAIFILFNIMSQSLITETLIISGKSHICIDYFGVVSESSIWGEWLASTPLIIYYSLSITNKNMGKIEIFFISTLFLSIFWGFLINIAKDKYSAALYLSLSFIFSISAIIMPFYVYFNFYRSKILHNSMITYNEKKFKELIYICFKLSIFIMTYVIVYGIVYLLSLSRILNETLTLVIFQIITIVTKNFYYEICLEDSITIIDKLEENYLDESKEHNARKRYFKSIIQEIYNPINVLVLGMELLKENFENKDIINSIKNAVNDLSSTINDVKMIQLIENETLKLNYESYSITLLISEIKNKVENIFDNMNVRFIVKSSNLISSLNAVNDLKIIYIDATYIKHVIISIIDYIIKNLVFPNSNLIIKINLNNDDDIASKENSNIFKFFEKSDSNGLLPNPLLNYLTFSIIYDGKNVERQDFNKLFERFNYEDKSIEKNIILDLYLCKKIIMLHGGYIWNNSNNSISFAIPITQNEPTGQLNYYNEIKAVRNNIMQASSINNIVNKLEIVDIESQNSLVKDNSNNNFVLLPSYNKDTNIKGNVLIINSLDKIIEKFIIRKNYSCDVIENFEINNDYFVFSKYVAIIIYHSSKTCNVFDICKHLRKKMYLNVIIVVTFDLETNYNSYIESGANLVLFYPIKPKELELLFS